jgi:hypothetical protein
MYKPFMLILSTIILFACNSTPGNTDITGTYVHHTSDETGQLWDTIEITTLNPDEYLYAVVKKSGIQNIRNGKDTLPIVVKKTDYTATYSPDNNNFHIKELDADYIVDAGKKTISNAQVKFEKVE